MKIYIGTANWGKPYGMNQVKVSHNEIDRILTVADAHDCGIETAYDYDCMDELKGLGDQFNIIFKFDEEEQYITARTTIGNVQTMKHHPPYIYTVGNIDIEGFSIYSPKDNLNDIIEVPFNIIDTRFGLTFADRSWASGEINLARSVFIQGLAFQMPDFHGIPFYHLCWNFVRNNPNIDGIVVGVDTAEQLEDILNIPQYEIDYSKIGSDGWFRKY